MSTWESGTQLPQAADAAQRTPPVIGEAHIYLYGYAPGQSAVQLVVPDAAKFDAPNPGPQQAQFQAAVIREFASGFALVS